MKRGALPGGLGYANRWAHSILDTRDASLMECLHISRRVVADSSEPSGAHHDPQDSSRGLPLLQPAPGVPPACSCQKGMAKSPVLPRGLWSCR